MIPRLGWSVSLDSGAPEISYARARLWLGISGVGLIVVACMAAILVDLPRQFLPTSHDGSVDDLRWVLLLIGSVMLLMAPLDFLGGYYVPTRFQRRSTSFSSFLVGWAKGVAVQAILFFFSSVLILTVGRSAGLVGVLITIAVMSLVYVGFQHRLVLAMTGRHRNNDRDNEDRDKENDKMHRSMDRASSWGLKKLPITIVYNTDPGFTGGVVGLPRYESIIVPRDFVDRLTVDQLAVVLGRRMVAVESGGRTRGILLAVLWIVFGFGLAASLPSAGVASVSELATTCLGFTVWMFFGLLTLPTISRQASYAIDGEVFRRGASTTTMNETIRALDAFGDDEASRGALVETIFHPVPSVENRQRETESGHPWAWNTARMTLFLSWSCMGLLARAVHCNVGRPELWVMFPVD